MTKTRKASVVRGSLAWLFVLMFLGGIAHNGYLWLESKAQRRQATQARLRADLILLSNPLGVVVCSEEGEIAFFNPTAEKMFGWKASEVLGKPVSKLMDHSNGEAHDLKFKAAVEELRKTKEPWQVTQVTRRRVLTGAVKKDGTKFNIEMSVRGICYDNNIEFIAIIKDPSAPREESSPFMVPSLAEHKK